MPACSICSHVYSHTSTQKQKRRMHWGHCIITCWSSFDDTDASLFLIWPQHRSTQTTAKDYHKEPVSPNSLVMSTKIWDDKENSCTCYHTYTKAGLCCIDQIPAQHPEWRGCCLSWLFMAAKSGTLIHLGGVAELVLKTQMGNELEQDSIIWSYKHTDVSFKICHCATLWKKMKAKTTYKIHNPFIYQKQLCRGRPITVHRWYLTFVKNILMAWLSLKKDSSNTF